MLICSCHKAAIDQDQRKGGKRYACRLAERTRSHAAGVTLSVFALVLVVCALVPRAAYAADSGGAGGGHVFNPASGRVFYGPVEVASGSELEVGVAAGNKYDAAALAIGNSPETVASWGNDVRTKLCNASTGGHFYELSTFFSHPTDAYYILDVYKNASAVFGSENVWRARYTAELRDQARSDLSTILSGGNVDSGSDNHDWQSLSMKVHDAQIYTFDSSTGAISYTTNLYPVYMLKGFDGTDTPFYVPHTSDVRGVGLATNYNVQVDQSITYYALSYANSLGWSDPGVLFTITSTGTLMTLRALLVHADAVTEYRDVNGKFVGYRYNSDECKRIHLSGRDRLGFGLDWPSINEQNLLGYTLRFDVTVSTYQDYPVSNGIIWSTYEVSSCLTTKSGNVWPEPPVVPGPPSVPSPPVVEPDPPAPYDPPVEPDPPSVGPITIVTPPDNSVIIDWLRAIFLELQAFHDDVYDLMVSAIQSLYDLQVLIDNIAGQFYQLLLDINDDIGDEFTSLKAYLKRLAEWLAEQLNFESDPYNDSNVIYWLKRIWARLGDGFNTRPVDPTVDPFGVWEWLTKLLEQFLLGLAITSTEVISQCAEFMSAVMHQFPFSIPWDIAAFLAAFAAAPITPVFTVKIAAVNGWWQEVPFVIDMSPFDSVAATTRTMEKILFAAFLAWKSKELLDFMDVTKWFNA